MLIWGTGAFACTKAAKPRCLQSGGGDVSPKPVEAPVPPKRGEAPAPKRKGPRSPKSGEGWGPLLLWQHRASHAFGYGPPLLCRHRGFHYFRAGVFAAFEVLGPLQLCTHGEVCRFGDSWPPPLLGTPGPPPLWGHWGLRHFGARASAALGKPVPPPLLGKGLEMSNCHIPMRSEEAYILNHPPRYGCKRQ